MTSGEANLILSQIDSDGNPYGGCCPVGLTNFDGSLTVKGIEVVRACREAYTMPPKRFKYLFEEANCL